jgi:type 2 lantibiotic biosynthesis protein LanM
VTGRDGTDQPASWRRALTLAERQAALPRGLPACPTNDDHERLARWRAQYPFDSDEVFAERLAVAGLSKAEFTALLDLPADAIGLADGWPAWAGELHRAYSEPLPDAPPEVLGHLRQVPAAGFLRLIEPLLCRGCARLRQGMEALASDRDGIPFDPKAIETVLLNNSLRRFNWMLGRTLVLELHVARLSGLLKGETGAARFASFAELLGERQTALSLFEEYPVLARQLVQCVDQWVDNSLEFLIRLCADFDAVVAMFNGGRDPGALTEVHNDAGDRHCNGRAVIIAGFSSGFRVVYKPRSLGIDVHFAQLMRWVNERGFEPAFRHLRALDRGTYGWEEFVAAENCATEEELRRFYARQGGNLALLYLLEATDFHHENLIAAGEHPLLLDLEALFSPWLVGPEWQQKHRFAETAMIRSVLRTGMLPQGDPEQPDFSGLGSVEGQLSPVPVPQWEDLATDSMRYTRKPMPMRGAVNQPTVAGAPVVPANHAEALAAGFRDVYRIVLRHREEFLADRGPLAAFVGDEIRVIFRPTLTYGHLLEESFHPDVLRDALDRDCLFDRLWVQISRSPHLARIIPPEQMSLQQGDIPRFRTCPGSRDVWTDAGGRLDDILDEAALDMVRRRVAALGEEDLARQVWLIRSSLAAHAYGSGRRRRPAPAARAEAGPVGPERLIAAAQAIGDRLGVLSVRDGDAAGWIGTAPIALNRWSLVPLGPDLYDGVAGIGLFLAHLGAITSDARHTELARAALAAFRRQARHDNRLARNIGGFSGWGGAIYALGHLSRLWNEPALIAEAEEIVGSLAPMIREDKQFDIISGSAGCILCLLGQDRLAPSGGALAAAKLCGDHLLERVTVTEHGPAWLNPALGKQPLAGFSHGVAGIAYALLELAGATGDERYRTAALAALGYERALFDGVHQNWPDLRETPALKTETNSAQGSVFVTAWCHGAPGIGLSRLAMLRQIDDSRARAEILAALNTTRRFGFGDNHSLCHGDLGNLELLRLAGEWFGDAAMEGATDRVISAVVEGAEREGWRCGAPFDIEVPGLMTGLAGIGYGLLRTAEPARVPSVLLLAPPLS